MHLRFCCYLLLWRFPLSVVALAVALASGTLVLYNS